MSDEVMDHSIGHSASDTCPACGAEVEMPDDAELGEILWCDNCGMELEVISVDPPRVQLFEEEEK
jgi:alpha-aminoadipate/glutamate carrier protein LysW